MKPWPHPDDLPPPSRWEIAIVSALVCLGMAFTVIVPVFYWLRG